MIDPETFKKLLERIGLTHGHAQPRLHVAVMHEPFLSYLFEGKKTIESRFSIHKIAPYQHIKQGDIVLLKAGPIVGSFTIDWVKYFDLKVHSINDIRKQYEPAICGDHEFWKSKSAKHYATLAGITNVQRWAPLKIKKRDRRAWVTL